MEQLKLKSGMPAVMIPYKSSNEMILSVIEGQTMTAIVDPPPTVPQVKGGKVKALAVTGAERAAELPDVPSMASPAIPASMYICGGSLRRRRRHRPSSPGWKKL